MSTSLVGQYVGPYKLEKTLGRGQTGLVKVGVHCVTGMKVAIKIINREKLSENVVNKVEREIAIMKLIEHPHILGLYDVYENRKYFHRDLKPENLLLDERNNIKVADFGMASLQPDGLLLETSCGSPHYACPEVIKGDKYDGRTADVWSCGVILYALLVGALPFDDDNLRLLLEKVKRGVFNIPCLVPSDAQYLLRGMINLNPAKRLTLKQVLNHPWMRPSSNEGSTHIPQPPKSILYCNPVANENSVDPDVLSSMSSLGCFSDKDILISNLLKEEQNTEKVVYYMLLRRKMRYPSFDDDACSLPCKHPDAPRKRVDSASSLDLTRSGYFDGIDDTKRKLSTESLNMTDRPSPLISRRRAIDKHQRSRSLTGDASPRRLFSTSCDPKVSNQIMVNQAVEQAKSIQNDPPIPWKQRLSNLKNSVMGSPRFHRRKMQVPSSEEVAKASDSNNEISKRSWFGSFIANHLLPAEHCEDFPNSIFFSGRTLRSLKVELGHAFLSLPSLSYEMVTPTRFQCDYRSAGSSSTSMFSYRTIKFQVDIVCKGTDIKPTHNAETISDYMIMFTHLSGSTRRFKRILELLQNHLTSCTAGQTYKNGRNIHC